jgi:predicted signal transduction protein with EAL and GGDEF domain
MSGDEFAILLPSVRRDMDLGNIALKIQNSLRRPFMIDQEEIYLTVSTGIGSFPRDGSDVQELLKMADSAMRQAKACGRNNYKFYSPELLALSERRQLIESYLKSAIYKNELDLVFQSQIDMNSGELVGFEALLRWENSKLGKIAPAEFIVIAEESGMINEIGDWVLRQVCLSAISWNSHKDKRTHVKFAVNLSTRQFLSENFIRKIEAVIFGTGCSPEWLEFEITESLLLEDNEDILTIFKSLREMGISIAIDDFGVGYSALAYLKKFPVDVVKIDKLFIQDITNNPKSAELVKAIVSMAQNMNLGMIIEGVETPDQKEKLLECCCRYGQGYLFSRPMALSRFENNCITV